MVDERFWMIFKVAVRRAWCGEQQDQYTLHRRGHDDPLVSPLTEVPVRQGVTGGRVGVERADSDFGEVDEGSEGTRVPVPEV